MSKNFKTVSRYPVTGTAKSSGENVIELAYGPGAKVKSVLATVEGNASVKINGQETKPTKIYGNGKKEFFHKHVINDSMGERPGVHSLVIDGDADYFVELNVYDSAW